MRQDSLSAVERDIVACVEKYGWFAMSVAPRADSDDPEEWFTYTIGLPQSHGWPELVCFGLAGRTAHNVIADAIDACETKGLTPEAGLELDGVLEGYNIRFEDGSRMADEYMNSAIWYAQYRGSSTRPTLLQLLWPDREGRFPGNPECAPGISSSQTPLELGH